MIRKTVLGLCAILMIGLCQWPVPAASATIPETKADQALVIFYRSKKFSGGAVRFQVNHAQGSMGSLGNGTMVYGYWS